MGCLRGGEVALAPGLLGCLVVHCGLWLVSVSDVEVLHEEETPKNRAWPCTWFIRTSGSICLSFSLSAEVGRTGDLGSQGSWLVAAC